MQLDSIAIATMVGNNYGNRLQNYAMQIALESICDCKDVFTLKADQRFVGAVKLLAKQILLPFARPNRWTHFAKFDKAFIQYSRYTLSEQEKCLDNGCDFFIIGSDQVWNPTFPMTSELNYLPFVPSNKKIAYAASFGVRRIEDNTGAVKRLLDAIPFISVREDSGAEIVKSLTGRDVPVVLDPTMLLDSEKWSEVAQRPSLDVSPQNFLLSYVLGDDVHSSEISAIARKGGLSVVDLKDRSLPVGPAEFVWLVKNAAIVCTDSFHASVFSILFHVPFVIFERCDAEVDMSSRFDTLCGTFGLEGHRVKMNGPEAFSFACQSWEDVEERLEEGRAASLGYLSEALKGLQA